MFRNVESSVTDKFLQEHRNSIREEDSWAPFGFAGIQTPTLPQIAENSCQIGPKTDFRCIECCDKSTDIGKLTEHLATEHVEYAPYLCTFDGCRTSRYSRRKLEEHIRAKRHGKITTFMYEEDKGKRRWLIDLLEASCGSGNNLRTNPLIKLEDDEEKPPEVEEMPHVPMPSSTPGLPFLDDNDNDFCDVEESASNIAAEEPLCIDETEKDQSAVTHAKAPKSNKVPKYEQSATGKVPMEPMDTSQQRARNCPNESEIGNNIEIMDMMIDSTGKVVAVTKRPIENNGSRPQTEIVNKKLNDFDDKLNDYLTPKINLGEMKQKPKRVGKPKTIKLENRNEKHSSPVVPVKSRQRRKACHPAIITKKDRQGFYLVSIDPNLDLTPTPQISTNVTTTIERQFESHKVKLLRIDGKRDSWTKMIGFIMGRAVNTYFRSYTESALPFRTPYYFVGDIPSLPEASVKQQLMALPEPVFTWFQLTLADDLVRNELEEMTEQESRYTMWHAMNNVRKGVNLGHTRYRKQERM